MIAAHHENQIVANQSTKSIPQLVILILTINKSEHKINPN